MQRVQQLLGSKKAFWVIIAIFLLQAIVFAVSIKPGTPPDEFWHVGFIQYYSEQPISHGPFITKQSPDTMWMGDLQRFPNYLYHYTMGSLVKLLNHLPLLKDSVFYVLRFVSIGLVLASLFVLRKILRELKLPLEQQNIVLGLMTLTTMFVAMAGAINYDGLLFLVTNLFLLVLIRFMKTYSAKNLAWLIVLGTAGLQTKFTFYAMLVPTIIALVAIALTKKDAAPKLIKSTKQLFAKQKITAVILSLLVVVSLGFAIERQGVNLYKYHAIKQSCEQIHGDSQCRQYTIYLRDVDVKKEFQELKKTGQATALNPIVFAKIWVGFMFERNFFYFGHFWAQPSSHLKMFFALIAGIWSVAVIRYYRYGKVLKSDVDKVLVFTVLFYLFVQYLYNYSAHLENGQFFATQGRYLLPILPIIYIYLMKLSIDVYTVIKRKNLKQQKLIDGVILSAIALLIFNLAPLLTFYRGVDPIVFTESTRGFNIKVQNILTTTHIAEKDSLPHYIQPGYGE